MFMWRPCSVPPCFLRLAIMRLKLTTLFSPTNHLGPFRVDALFPVLLPFDAPLAFCTQTSSDRPVKNALLHLQLNCVLCTIVFSQARVSALKAAVSLLMSAPETLMGDLKNMMSKLLDVRSRIFAFIDWWRLRLEAFSKAIRF